MKVHMGGGAGKLVKLHDTSGRNTVGKDGVNEIPIQMYLKNRAITFLL